MQNKSAASNTKSAKKPVAGQRLKRFKRGFRRDWQLHLLLALPVIYLAIFNYWPMYGLQIAFRDFKPRAGISGSEWVGFKWFEKFFTDFKFEQLVSNTLIVSIYSLLVSFVLAVGLALLINVIENERFKKFIQQITYMPHFISIVILVAMLNQILNPVNGLYGNLYHLMGGDGYPTDIRSLESTFRHLYVWSGVWQNVGWDTIIYTSALAAVDKGHHEAAMIDGATRLQRIRHVDLPTILPTCCIMLILKFGHVMGVGFEKVFLMQSQINLGVSEVISTYVYKVGMGTSMDFAYGAAIGLFNSVVNCTMVIFVNWLSKKLSSGETSLF